MSATDHLSQQFAHLSVRAAAVQPGDLVQPLYPPGARYEQATGASVHDPEHPMGEDMYVIPYGNRLGPHTPADVRQKVYRRKA